MFQYYNHIAEQEMMFRQYSHSQHNQRREGLEESKKREHPGLSKEILNVYLIQPLFTVCIDFLNA
jgi:hypothetical protein